MSISADNPRNQNGIGKQELLVISVGTSHSGSRKMSIGALEDAMEQAFPDYSVRRGFTSQRIIHHIREHEGVVIDSVTEALDRAVFHRVSRLVIQPALLISGLEYQRLVDEAAGRADAFAELTVGEPLLSTQEDVWAVVRAMTGEVADYDDGKTAMCFLGHGTDAHANRAYTKIQGMLTEAGYANCYVGTLKAKPALGDVLSAVKKGCYRRILLVPLMISAGMHALEAMGEEGCNGANPKLGTKDELPGIQAPGKIQAGARGSSWKSVFEAEGYEVRCLKKGLGELPAIRQIFVQHVRMAIHDSFDK